VRRAPVELVLAVDADCHRCRSAGAAAAARVPGLEVAPLRDYRVAAWRAEAYDDDPPWAPTLLAVTVSPDGIDAVRAWHGPAVATGLVVTLGVRGAAALAPVLAGLLGGEAGYRAIAWARRFTSPPRSERSASIGAPGSVGSSRKSQRRISSSE
jgi:hypothetical protein